MNIDDPFLNWHFRDVYRNCLDKICGAYKDIGKRRSDDNKCIDLVLCSAGNSGRHYQLPFSVILR